MAPPSTRAVLRQLARPVYIPWLLVSFGMGMLVPVLPIYLRSVGLSFTMTSVVLAATGIGAALGGLPTGLALARVGERVLMLFGVVLTAVTAAALGLSEAIAVLIVLQFAIGVGTVATRLSGQTLVTRLAQPHMRGRAMSLMGGSQRVAMLLGPLLGGWLLDTIGSDKTFLATGAIILLGLIAPARSGASTSVPEPASEPGNAAKSLRQHRRLLIRTGVGPALVMTARTGRMVVVPLVADQLGLSPTAIGALVAVGTAADLALFPVAGYVMDRFGRLAAMVPAFGLLAVGLFLLAAATTAEMVLVAGVVMGVGNGLSSGTLLTMGSDIAPPEVRGPFLAGLAAMQDTGKVLGPLVVGWFADTVGLGASAFVLGVVMVIAIGWIILVIGETLTPDPV